MGRSLKALGIGIAVVLIAAAMIVGSQQILKRINTLATANSDNVQWTLSQVEVEYLALLLAILRARADPAADLSEVRQHFDILYLSLIHI